MQWDVGWVYLAVAQERRSTLPKGAGCCVMMKKSAAYRCVPHPSPLVMGDWIVLAGQSPLFIDLYGKGSHLDAGWEGVSRSVLRRGFLSL